MIKELYNKFKTYLITGLITIIPITIIIFAMEWFVALLLEVFWHYIPDETNSLYSPVNLILLIIGIVLTIGFVVSLIFKIFTNLKKQNKLLSLPLLNNIFKSYKRISNNNKFKTAVLVQYPIKDSWAVGFITSEITGQIAKTVNSDGKKFVSVFVPNANSTENGNFLIVQEKDIKKLKMTVDEAMEFVVSLGSVVK